MEPAHEYDFIESKCSKSGSHDVEYDSPLDVPKTNATAGHTDKARENDEAA